MGNRITELQIRNLTFLNVRHSTHSATDNTINRKLVAMLAMCLIWWRKPTSFPCPPHFGLKFWWMNESTIRPPDWLVDFHTFSLAITGLLVSPDLAVSQQHEHFSHFYHHRDFFSIPPAYYNSRFVFDSGPRRFYPLVNQLFCLALPCRVIPF